MLGGKHFINQASSSPTVPVTLFYRLCYYNHSLQNICRNQKPGIMPLPFICSLHISTSQVTNSQSPLHRNLASHLLSCKVEGCSPAMVSLIDICSCFQKSICTVQSVCQHTVHEWCSSKLVFFVFKSRVSCKYKKE